MVGKEKFVEATGGSLSGGSTPSANAPTCYPPGFKNKSFFNLNLVPRVF